LRIPNSEHAIVDIEKLESYCLSDTHPRGKHKAHVFLSRLGMDARHASLLRDQLLEGVALNDKAEPSTDDRFGQRYMLDLDVNGPKGNAIVRTSWIISSGEDVPRLVTCFVR